MKQLLLCILIIFLTVPAFAQYEPVEYESPKPEWRDKLGIGGGLGLSFGTITNVDLSPRIEYQVFNRLSVGIGGSYIYYNNKYYHFKTTLYGMSAFTSFTLIKDLRDILPFENPGSVLLHVEANWLNLDPAMDFYSYSSENRKVLAVSAPGRNWFLKCRSVKVPMAFFIFSITLTNVCIRHIQIL